jgi:hypothetical protein
MSEYTHGIEECLAMLLPYQRYFIIIRGYAGLCHAIRGDWQGVVLVNASIRSIGIFRYTKRIISTSLGTILHLAFLVSTAKSG